MVSSSIIIKKLWSYFYMTTISMSLLHGDQENWIVVKSTLSAKTLAPDQSLETCFMIGGKEGQLPKYHSNLLLH